MKTTSILMSLALTLASGQVQAQFVVKRVKCADAAVMPGLPVDIYHRNHTTITKNLAIQIIRDGCRPKAPVGEFRVRVMDISWNFARGAIMPRRVKFPSSVIETVDANQLATVNFVASGRVSGTFDYMYSWD